MANGKLTIEEKARLYDERVEKEKRYARRQQARYTLMLKKAHEAGITVTDDEIDKYMKAKGWL